MSLFLLGTKYLHSLVYIIADQPGADNISPDVPLVGTDSYKTLLKWLGEMNVDISRVRMYNQCDSPFDNFLSRETLNKAIALNQIKVIALGQKAAAYLNRTGIEEYYILPHPSGRNRLLNNKEYVKEKLGACERYIYQGVLDGQSRSEENLEEDLSEEPIFPPESEPG